MVRLLISVVLYLNEIENFEDTVKNSELGFEVNPLDINIAQLQLTFKNKLEELKTNNEQVSNISESYFSKDTVLRLSEINVSYKKSEKGYNLVLNVVNKAKDRTFEYELRSGDEEEINAFILSPKFFSEIKFVTTEVNKEYC